MVTVLRDETWRHRAWRSWAIIVAALVLGQLSWIVASTASACQPTTVCFYWDAAFDDSNVGEDYFKSGPVQASGARVVLLRPPPETPLTSSLDSDGCITFDTQYSYGHKALVYADAVIGGVRLLAAFDNNAMDPTSQAVPQTVFWEAHLHGLEPGGSAIGIAGAEIGLDQEDLRVRMLPIIAAATATMRRFEDLGVMPPTLAPDETIYLAYRPVFGNARCHCSGTSPSVVDIGVDSFREKFVIAHELGHWLDATWNGNGPGAYSYSYDAIDDACKFDIVPATDIDMSPINSDGGVHGMRQAHYGGGALVEGIAHFISAITWNDFAVEDGVFRYYKDIDLEKAPSYQDFVDGGSLIALEGGLAAGTVGGQSRWVASQCPTDWAAWTTTADVMSEMDWMRFWWRFLSDQATDQPTLDQILGFTAFVQANDPWTTTQVWPQLSDNVEAAGSPLDGFGQRFADLADEEGVNP
ncbi:MAG TPA: hypothetical protein PLV93_11035 [Microthrixaceae bacterium]|nr:hypothetical protein [Nannocystaceae bacterium]HNI35928.1 hypothetical protein [Microthrixaceae bacterium]